MTTANLPIAQRVTYLLYPTALLIARSMALALIGAVLLAIAAKIQLARRDWDKNLWKVGLAMIIGNIIIYALGLLWLGNLISWDKPVLQFGMLNFLLGDAVKIILAAVALSPIVKVLCRRGDSE